MNFFLLNLLLAGTWAALNGDFSESSLIAGFVLGYAALWFTQPLFGQGPNPYFRRIYRVIRLFVYFLYDLTVSSISVVWDVITPTHLANPSLVEMPLDVTSDAEILLVTNLISLTPGTLSVDVSEDRKTLTVHAMFGDDPDALIAHLKNGMERMVREVFE